MKYFLLNYKGEKVLRLLSANGPNNYILEEDNSQWCKYDYYFETAHGSTEGYYRYPLPNYETLLSLLFGKLSDQFDHMNAIGAAEVLIRVYSKELLRDLFVRMNDTKSYKEYKNGFIILSLYFNSEKFNPNKEKTIKDRQEYNAFFSDLHILIQKYVKGKITPKDLICLHELQQKGIQT